MPNKQAVSPRRVGKSTGLLGLDAVQIFDDRLDVVGAERENRHVRMPGYDPFGERLGKV
jgi:hypothetical protein